MRELKINGKVWPKQIAPFNGAKDILSICGFNQRGDKMILQGEVDTYYFAETSKELAKHLEKMKPRNFYFEYHKISIYDFQK